MNALKLTYKNIKEGYSSEYSKSDDNWDISDESINLYFKSVENL